MTFIIQFGAFLPKIKRGILFGVHERHPLRLINFLFFSVVIPIGETKSLFAKALSGLIKDDDWFIKNALSVRRERSKVRAKVFTEKIEHENERITLYRDELIETKSKLQKVLQEKRELETALKVMNSIRV